MFLDMDSTESQMASHEKTGIAKNAGIRYEEILLRDAYEKIQKGRYGEAENILADILKRFAVTLEKSQKSLIESELGTVLFWLGDYESAKKYCEQSLMHRDDNDQAYVILGKIAVAEYKFPEARGYFNKISDENPAKKLGLCLVSIKLRDTKAALHFLQETAPLIGSRDPEYRLLAAYCRLLSGNSKNAVTEARELLPKCERDPALTLLIAEIFMTAGNYGEAVAAVKKVSKVCPENDHSYALLAHAAYSDEDLGAAENTAERAIRLNPRNAYAKTVLMKIATRRGSYALAESIGREILEQSPEYSLGHANLGDVYFIQGRYELAEIEYEQTFDLMNADTKGSNLRQARMKFIRKDYTEAAKILEKLIESHHAYYDDAMCDLALCYDTMGDEEKKSAVLEKMELRKDFYHRTEKLLQELL